METAQVKIDKITKTNESTAMQNQRVRIGSDCSLLLKNGKEKTKTLQIHIGI